MQGLIFERRTLKPYLVEVPPADLVVGHVYFRVSFLDEDMVVPEWFGLIFLGRDLNSQLPGLYFQDAESFFAGERSSDDMWVSAVEDGGDSPDGYSWVGDHMRFDWVPERSRRSSVCDFEAAPDQLLACSLRRKKWDGIVRPVADREHPE
jgi:hypothetical protein